MNYFKDRKQKYCNFKASGISYAGGYRCTHVNFQLVILFLLNDSVKHR